MSYLITNLIKHSTYNASIKRFLNMMSTYCDPDGTNIYPSTFTIANDWGLSERGVIKMRNEVIREGLLICVELATSKMAAKYSINLELLMINQRCGKPVKRINRGELSSGLGVNSVQGGGELSSDNLPVTYQLPCINTVGIDKPVDNLNRRNDSPPIQSGDRIHLQTKIPLSEPFNKIVDKVSHLPKEKEIDPDIAAFIAGKDVYIDIRAANMEKVSKWKEHFRLNPVDSRVKTNHERIAL